MNNATSPSTKLTHSFIFAKVISSFRTKLAMNKPIILVAKTYITNDPQMCRKKFIVSSMFHRHFCPLRNHKIINNSTMQIIISTAII